MGQLGSALSGPFFDKERWRGKSVTLRLNPVQLSQQAIVDVKVAELTVVCKTNEDNPGLTRAGHIIGKRTDGPSEPSRRGAVQRFLVLNAEAFALAYQLSQCCIGQSYRFLILTGCGEKLGTDILDSTTGLFMAEAVPFSPAPPAHPPKHG